MIDLETFRRRKDQYFANDPHSPLTPEQRDLFDGLRYYPENPDLRFELEAERLDEPDEVSLQTSTGDITEYLRWGRVHFEVEGQSATLTLYATPGLNSFFLPFMDATNGEETYGAGRYLEVEPLADGKLLLDFNIAYNPYCAYNEHWSCPLTPKENRLTVPIQAGEMKPSGPWAKTEQT